MDIAIIVPAYNEEEKIDGVLSELLGAGYCVIVIDDGSTDNTFNRASRHPVHLLRHPFNMGQGAAIQTGIEYALSLNVNIMVTYDADGQHCSDDIYHIINPLRLGTCDVVFGSRFKGSHINMPWLRKWLIIIMTRSYNCLYDSKLSDINCGIRGFNRNAASQIMITQNRMAHTLGIIEQTTAHNFRYMEVPVTVTYTDYSLQKGQKIGSIVRLAFDWVMR